MLQCIWAWVGTVVVDLALGPIQFPESKIAALQSMLEQAKCIFVRASYLASMLEKIVFMILALGPVSRFMMAHTVRSFYTVLESRQFWSEPLQLSQDAKVELRVGSSELRMYMY